MITPVWVAAAIVGDAERSGDIAELVPLGS